MTTEYVWSALWIVFVLVVMLFFVSVFMVAKLEERVKRIEEWLRLEK